jgi:hypothetical protein
LEVDTRRIGDGGIGDQEVSVVAFLVVRGSQFVRRVGREEVKGKFFYFLVLAVEYPRFIDDGDPLLGGVLADGNGNDGYIKAYDDHGKEDGNDEEGPFPYPGPIFPGEDDSYFVHTAV